MQYVSVNLHSFSCSPALPTNLWLVPQCRKSSSFLNQCKLETYSLSCKAPLTLQWASLVYLHQDVKIRQECERTTGRKLQKVMLNPDSNIGLFLMKCERVWSTPLFHAIVMSCSKFIFAGSLQHFKNIVLQSIFPYPLRKWKYKTWCNYKIYIKIWRFRYQFQTVGFRISRNKHRTWGTAVLQWCFPSQKMASQNWSRNIWLTAVKSDMHCGHDLTLQSHFCSSGGLLIQMKLKQKKVCHSCIIFDWTQRSCIWYSAY